MILKIIFLAVALYGAYRLIKVITEPEKEPRRPQGMGGGNANSSMPEEETVYDEVCLKYIPKSLALEYEHMGKKYYFCSGECRQKFLDTINNPY
ncbi:MAG TPA: YHS domain-containing protein [Deltaproteobacteria bacterium]|nr:YHS domain-containing protein [Deltaproteobacteria bacterium]